eukprot:GILK01004017.1.p1 GENE.GILK01004017.1~~GILK01004017.1.p1  ORF type:complete len:367 (-),score=43.78 GILK01004017.1:170-1228(-)
MSVLARVFVAAVGSGVRLVSRAFSIAFNIIGRFLPFSLTAPALESGETMAQKFLAKFESVYGNSHPKFFQGSYTDALAVASQELKFLVIYIHSDYHFDTDEFCRHTMCDPSVVTTLDELFVCWAATIHSSDGFQAGLQFAATRFPFLAVISTADRETTVIDLHEGPISADALVTRLTNLLSEHQDMLAAATAQRTALEHDRRLREEQDREYHALLAAEQERARRETEEAEQLQRETERVEREERERYLAEQERKRMKELKRSALAAEPAETTTGIARIAFRLPGGAKSQRRFLVDDPIQILYDYVDTLDIKFEGTGEYDLLMNMPRMLLTNKTITLREAGLVPQAMLYVQEK